MRRKANCAVKIKIGGYITATVNYRLLMSDYNNTRRNR